MATEHAPSPASPCVRQCCLDDEDICLGCGRHLSEILAWHSADPTQRRAILDRAAQRRRQRALRRHLPDSAPPPAPLPPVDPSS